MEKLCQDVLAIMPQVRRETANLLGKKKILSSKGTYHIVELDIANPTGDQIRTWIRYNIDSEYLAVYPSPSSLIVPKAVAKKILYGEWYNTDVLMTDVF